MSTPVQNEIIKTKEESQAVWLFESIFYIGRVVSWNCFKNMQI